MSQLTQVPFYSFCVAAIVILTQDPVKSPIEFLYFKIEFIGILLIHIIITFIMGNLYLYMIN